MTASTAGARRAFARLVEDEPEVRSVDAADYGELVARLDRRHPETINEGWRIIAALLRHLEGDAVAATALLVAVTPMMLAVARRLRWGSGGPWADREEFVAEVISTTWTAAHAMRAQPSVYPLHSLERRVTGRLERHRDRAARSRAVEVSTLFDGLDDAEARGPVEAELYRNGLLADRHPVPVLDALATALCAVEESVLDRKLVQLVYARRVLGYPIREVSSFLGESENAVEYQAARAEALLCAS
jgi:DNA-directed RNA polymerase specialized sigma24 family protein